MRSYLGSDPHHYAEILFMAFAVLSALLFLYQLRFLRTLRLVSIYLLPLLSFCICFQNVVLYSGDSIHPSSSVAKAAYVFASMICPLFIVIIYELALRLHESEFVHFLFLSYDEVMDGVPSSVPALGDLSVWILRVIALGLFIMGIFVNFAYIEYGATTHSAEGGLEYLRHHSTSLSLWLGLIPPLFLSIEAIIVGYALIK